MHSKYWGKHRLSTCNLGLYEFDEKKEFISIDDMVMPTRYMVTDWNSLVEHNGFDKVNRFEYC